MLGVHDAPCAAAAEARVWGLAQLEPPPVLWLNAVLVRPSARLLFLLVHLLSPTLHGERKETQSQFSAFDALWETTSAAIQCTWLRNLLYTS